MAGVKIYTGTVDVSSQPSGSQIVLKMTTTATKGFILLVIVCLYTNRGLNNIIGKKNGSDCTEKFERSSADSFKTSFGTDKYYLFVGKSQPWTSEGAATDSLPPAPVDSVAPESYYWDDMLAAKLIGTNNTTFAVPRRDYSTSTAFDMYRHDISGTTTAGQYPTRTTSSSGARRSYGSNILFYDRCKKSL